MLSEVERYKNKGTMKIKTIILPLLTLAAIASCNRYDSDGYRFDNSVCLDVSKMKTVQQTTFGNNIPEVRKTIAATLAYPAGHNVKATIALDNSLVADYNTLNGTDYELLPSEYCDFTSASVDIPAGRTTSEPVEILFKGLMGEGMEQTGALAVDRTYLFPVRITSGDMDVMTASSVAYYLVRRSSAITVAAQLTDNWINFPLMDEPGPVAEAYNGLKGITYEALINIDKFDLSNSFGACSISSIMGVEQYLLLRIGDVSFERRQLQFDGSGAGTAFDKFPKSDPTKILETGRWYHVACTYDYAERNVRIYVDGKLQSEGRELGSGADGINLAMRALEKAEPGKEKTSYQFFIGKSYNDFRPLQGKIAEARVWSVARTADEIWSNMYRISDPENHPELIGYWKFDEGSGNTVRDRSIYHNDGIANSDLTWATAIEIPEINK